MVSKLELAGWNDFLRDMLVFRGVYCLVLLFCEKNHATLKVTWPWKVGHNPTGCLLPAIQPLWQVPKNFLRGVGGMMEGLLTPHQHDEMPKMFVFIDTSIKGFHVKFSSWPCWMERETWQVTRSRSSQRNRLEFGTQCGRSTSESLQKMGPHFFQNMVGSVW